jgi:hypothetical protein
MPNSIRVIRAQDFVRATPQGQFDLESSRQLLRDLADAAQRLEAHDVIIDIRNARSSMTADELWSLASTMAGDRRTFARKTAILCPMERFDRAWFFVQCADNAHLNLRAFTDYEAAMDWLHAEAS